MRKIISILLVLILLLTFAGCHGRLEEEKEALTEVFEVPEDFDEWKSYEITFWAKNDTNLTQVGIYKSAIEEFQKAYPNIKVNLRLYTDYSKIYNDVITNIATDTTPNVCITYPDHIATYLTGSDTVVALDKLMTDERYGLGGSRVKFDSPAMDEIVPKFLEECKINSNYYALPYMRSTEACYVNKTFVEKLGYTLPETLTWDFVWEVADAATKKDTDGNFIVNSQKVMIPFMYKSTDNMMIQLLKQNEAGYSDHSGKIELFNPVTEEILMTIADHSGKGAFNTFKMAGYPANFLNAGQCIFAVDSTAGATWMGPDAPLVDISEEKLVDYEIKVMTIPQVDTENPCMISQGPSLCVFNKKDEGEVLASWLFAQFMLTNNVQIAYAQTEGYVPVTSKAQESEEYVNYLSRKGEDNNLHYSVKIDATNLLIENTENTFVTSVFNGSASLRDAAGQLIESVNKSVKRKETVDGKYIDSLYDEVTALYRLGDIKATMETGNMDPLPTESVVLIVVIALCWVCMGAYFIKGKIQKRKLKEKY